MFHVLSPQLYLHLPIHQAPEVRKWHHPHCAHLCEVEPAYRWEIDNLATWCSKNHLKLYILKTVEMLWMSERTQPHLDTSCKMMSFCFLGTIITQDLKWELNISCLTSRAPQLNSQGQWWCTFRRPSIPESGVHSNLYHHMICCNLCQGQVQTVAYHSIYREADWLEPAFTWGPVHLQVSEREIVADPSHLGHDWFWTPWFLFWNSRKYK